jgi:hypothetical protein
MLIYPSLMQEVAFGACCPRPKSVVFGRRSTLREKRDILLEMDNKSPLALLVTGVRANDVHHAPAAHDLAVLADLLDRGTDFHAYPPWPLRP